MDKLNLDLNDLEVDSFQANPEQKGELGTVRGNKVTEYWQNCATERLDATCEGVVCTCEGSVCDDENTLCNC